ncbi:MAG: protein phosphatase 2C domain-containing protein [Pyrinomonadaceae bacterium]
MDKISHISSAAISDRGLSEKRPENEDSFLEMNQSGIFAVADGVGGAQAGEVASQMAIEIVGEAFANFADGADAEDVMRAAIERSNTAIYQMAHELPQLASMATTIVALHLAGNIATIGHVGDSRLYRVDREGNLFKETDDHSVVAEEVRAGRMTEEQAANHPSRNIISRALGAEPTIEAEIKTIMVEPGTSFLICSDGITRHVGDQEIKGVLTFGGDPADICEYLKSLCYERGAEDNLTAVVVKIAPKADQLVEHPFEPVLDEDVPTVATARSSFGYEESEDTREIAMAPPTGIEPDIVSPPVHRPEPRIEAEGKPQAVVQPDIREAGEPGAATEPFTIFGDAGEPKPEAGTSGSFRRIASAVGLILIGGLVGLGVYHLALAPKFYDAGVPQLSEMKTANIPLSAFEENRRDVDKDPTGYVAKYAATPQDCEDFYLLGRAYILTGDYVKARSALTESRNRLSDADPVNAKILASDIAIAMAVTNDTTIQTNLKKELDGSKISVNSNVKTNSNR